MSTLRGLILDNPDATDAEIAALANAPVHAPRAQRVTFTTLASSALWGTARTAQFKATLRAMHAGGGASGALADVIVGVLEGDGCEPADPQTLATVETLVGAGIVTRDEGTLALYTNSYPNGTNNTAESVAAVRAVMDREAEVAADDAEVTAAWNQWSHDRDVYVNNGGTRPAKPSAGA